MSTIGLEVKKKEIFREILNEKDENILSKVIAYIHKTKKTTITEYPCYFTDEEKQARIEQSIRDAKAGLGITHDEMFKNHPEWL
jgi:hypothetical protein